jgi:hypothetical protein
MSYTSHLPDLAARARLAVGCLTRHGDPGRGLLPWFYTRLDTSEVRAALQVWSYGDGLGRAVDALCLLRTMLGEVPDREREDRTMSASLLSLLGADGLSWCPAEPWTRDVAHTRPAWLQQGTLLALTSLWLAGGDRRLHDAAERLVAAVAALGVERDGHLEFPGDTFDLRDGWTSPPDDPWHRRSVFATSIAMPLMRWHRASGSPAACALAGKLIAWGLADHAGGEDLFTHGHFHCQSRLVTALLLRAIASGDRAALAQGERLYLKARSLGTRSGWFPEQIANPADNRSNLAETCCLTDMIEAAVLLARHADPVYWDDAERFARNHLLVHQYDDLSWCRRCTTGAMDSHPIGFAWTSGQGDSHGDHLLGSLRGGFAGWGGVTAMSDDSPFANINQQCCNAAGARALYDVWHHAIDDDGMTVAVNLHLPRATAAVAVQVASWAGREEITVKLQAPRRLCIRRPEGVTAWAATRDGRRIEAPLCDGFIELGDCAGGSTAILAWDPPEVETVETIAPGSFTFRWRGATVLAASPVQALHPLFTPDRFAAAPVEAQVGGRMLLPF